MPKIATLEAHRLILAAVLVCAALVWLDEPLAESLSLEAARLNVSFLESQVLDRSFTYMCCPSGKWHQSEWYDYQKQWCQKLVDQR